MNFINNLRGGHCLGRPGRGPSLVEKSPRLHWATQFLTVAYDGACSSNVYVRMSWSSFDALPCRGKKTWWQLAFWCCWNRARRLTCFLSASVTRKDLQFDTWTDPYFQRFYRFRPRTSGCRSGSDFVAVVKTINECDCSKSGARTTYIDPISVPIPSTNCQTGDSPCQYQQFLVWTPRSQRLKPKHPQFCVSCAQCLQNGRREAGTNYRGPAIRKGARCPNMLRLIF